MAQPGTALGSGPRVSTETCGFETPAGENPAPGEYFEVILQIASI